MKRLALSLLILTSCSPLPAYKRSQLVSESMKPNDSDDRRYETHVQQTRESSAGAVDSDGASCGCN